MAVTYTLAITDQYSNTIFSRASLAEGATTNIFQDDDSGAGTDERTNLRKPISGTGTITVTSSAVTTGSFSGTVYVEENGVGKWQFVPRFAANPNDGLPEDAWIPFMAEAAEINSTRTNTRPFSLKEQKSILLVGSCLECHDQDSELMFLTLNGFESVIARRTESCVLPDYYQQAVGSKQ